MKLQVGFDLRLFVIVRMENVCITFLLSWHRWGFYAHFFLHYLIFVIGTDISVCLSPLLLEPLPWTGDNRCEAIVDEFLSDHDSSQIMGFYGLFVYDNAGDHTEGLNIGLLPQVGSQVAMDLPVGVTTPQAGLPVWQSLLWSKFLRILGPVHATHASYILTIEFPSCYQNTMDHESLLIIDPGASVCITPHRSDFIMYKTSNMKIKDLSSSNKVAGEGLLRWKLEDRAGRVVNLDLSGYHIPGAEVCLLSPQVILLVFGGHTTQTA